MLPVMAKMCSFFPAYQFVVAGVSTQQKDFYSLLAGKNDIKYLFGKTYDLIEQSTAALVTSGTATLETALFGIPEVVCYKGSRISFQIAKMLVKVDYISLVNLIMGKEVVRELIQGDFNEMALKAELDRLLNQPDYRRVMTGKLNELKNKLGGAGASTKAAELMVSYLKN